LYRINWWGDCCGVYVFNFWMVDVGTTKLVGWILSVLALCIIVATTSLAYIETLYMKAQLKREMKELRKLKQELKETK
jgi:membrane protein insertase Oxa1/YidC/SpoIIIJ